MNQNFDIENDGFFVFTNFHNGTIGLGNGDSSTDGNGFVKGTSVNGEVIVPSAINGFKLITLRQYCFRNCDGITKLSLPRTLIYLESAALTCVRNVEEIVFPASIIEIGERTDSFVNVKKISFEIGSKIQVIGDYFLQFSHAIEEFILPPTITSLGSNFAGNCTNLRNIFYCGTSDFSVIQNCFVNCTSEISIYVNRDYLFSEFGGFPTKRGAYSKCCLVKRCITQIPYFNKVEKPLLFQLKALLFF